MYRGFDGLSAQVQHVLQKEPLSGHVFVFRGKRGDIVKLCGPMATDFVFSPSVLSVEGSSGPRLRVVRYHSRVLSFRCCLKGSIGGASSAHGNQIQQHDHCRFFIADFSLRGILSPCPSAHLRMTLYSIQKH